VAWRGRLAAASDDQRQRAGGPNLPPGRYRIEADAIAILIASRGLSQVL
jgi:hypothetical protein